LVISSLILGAIVSYGYLIKLLLVVVHTQTVRAYGICTSSEHLINACFQEGDIINTPQAYAKNIYNGNSLLNYACLPTNITPIEDIIQIWDGGILLATNNKNN